MRLSHLNLHRRAIARGFSPLTDSADDEPQLEERASAYDPERDVVKTVYVTASATFTGKVGGYSTVAKAKATKASEKDDDDDDDSETTKEAEKTTAAAKATHTAKSSKKTTKEAAETTKEKSTKKTTSEVESKTSEKATATKTTKKSTHTTSAKTDTSSVPSAITDATTGSVDTVLAKATGQASVSTTSDSGAAVSTTSAVSSSSATSEASSSGGSSTGTKAGIAFGVLGGIFVVGLIVFLLFSRRRKQLERERLTEDDEKLHGPINDVSVFAADSGPSTPRSDAKAPRVSLRPVTQFLPNWNGLDQQKRNSRGANMALAAPAGAALASRAPGGSAWERPSTASSTDPSNPFGVQAERAFTPVIEESEPRSMAPSPVPSKNDARPVSPMSATSMLPSDETPVVAEAVAATAVGAGTGAGGVALARKASMRKDGPKHLDLTLPNPPMAPVPASPAGTEFSVSSAAPGGPEPASQGAAAIAAAGGPANSAVHRVQLDFKPTLDDEMGLRAGDLVRLLHEYDDGWALCIRLDRSRQGVVPRTCLSTRPVKPRPQGAPRPGPPVNPNGPPRGPMSPPGQRPMTPQGRPMTPQGRPMTPNGGPPGSPAGRPMTPNGGRPQSPMGRPMTPNGGRPQSPMGRPMNAPGAPAGRPMSPGPRSQSPGPRPQSPNGMKRQNSPPGPSPMNPSQSPAPGPTPGPVGRKPVPGQAY